VRQVNSETLVLDRLRDVKQSGDGWTARCPAHDDGKASLSIEMGESGKVLLKCHAGCRTEDIVATVGLEMADLFRRHEGGKVKRRIVATYDYTDETGVCGG
jgi:putative DNA primase/helicase